MEKVQTKDKSLHTWLSCLIVLVVSCILHYGFKVESVTSCVIAVFSALFIGVLKEVVYDKKLKKGTFSWLDLLADFIGSVLGFAASLLITCNF